MTTNSSGPKNHGFAKPREVKDMAEWVVKLQQISMGQAEALLLQCGNTAEAMNRCKYGTAAFMQSMRLPARKALESYTVHLTSQDLLQSTNVVPPNHVSGHGEALPSAYLLLQQYMNQALKQDLETKHDVKNLIDWHVLNYCKYHYAKTTQQHGLPLNADMLKAICAAVNRCGLAAASAMLRPLLDNLAVLPLHSTALPGRYMTVLNNLAMQKPHSQDHKVSESAYAEPVELLYTGLIVTLPKFEGELWIHEELRRAEVIKKNLILLDTRRTGFTVAENLRVLLVISGQPL